MGLPPSALGLQVMGKILFDPKKIFLGILSPCKNIFRFLGIGKLFIPSQKYFFGIMGDCNYCSLSLLLFIYSFSVSVPAHLCTDVCQSAAVGCQCFLLLVSDLKNVLYFTLHFFRYGSGRWVCHVAFSLNY
jgi:hypothetical protein